MLAHLSIRNFALIERLDLPFDPGLSVMTGETGAGKSITLDALGLLLGGRASADLIRTGADEASVQGLFVVGARRRDEVRAMLRDAGMDETDEIVVRRTLSRDAANRVWINDALATAALASRLLSPLVDVIGQHQHLSLLRPETHRRLIDEFGDHDGLLDRMRAAHRAWKDAASELQALEEAGSARAERLEFLRFQKGEIDALGLREGEFEALEADLARARNAGRLGEASRAASAALVDGRHAAGPLIADAVEALRRAAALDPEAEPLARAAEELSVLVDDLGRDVARYAAHINIDVDVDALESRHETIRRAMKRYQLDIDGLLGRAAEIVAEIDRLDNYADRLDQARANAERTRVEADAVAAELTAARRAAASRLFEAAAPVIAELGMPRARLELSVQPARLAAHGADDLEIMFGANPGEPLGPLRKVASGGELSRLMLGIKVALIDSDPVDTYVFDEIDTGIGGAIAEVVGRRLSQLARERQVVCVTHLPQIASFGDAHYRVSKHVNDGRTVSAIERLDEQERADEVARMLGGVTLTDATRAHAHDMLRNARETWTR